MPHVMRVNRTGGTDSFPWETADIEEPGPGQARMRQSAIGVNYIDIYHRTGDYAHAQLADRSTPARPGR